LLNKNETLLSRHLVEMERKSEPEKVDDLFERKFE